MQWEKRVEASRVKDILPVYLSRPKGDLVASALIKLSDELTNVSQAEDEKAKCGQ